MQVIEIGSQEMPNATYSCAKFMKLRFFINQDQSEEISARRTKIKLQRRTLLKVGECEMVTLFALKCLLQKVVLCKETSVCRLFP